MEFTLSLINEVRNCPSIWDKGIYPMCKNRLAYEKDWIAISKKLNTRKDILKNKWKNLRDIYLRQLKKNKRLEGTLTEGGFHRQWYFFEAMSFMGDLLKAKEARRSRLEVEDEDDDTTVVEDNSDPLGRTEDVTGNNCIETLMDIKPSLSELNDIGKKRTPETSDAEGGSMSVEMAADKHFEPYNIIDTDNDDMLFFRSLAPYMSAMDPLTKLNIRTQFLNIVMAEMKKRTQ